MHAVSRKTLMWALAAFSGIVLTAGITWVTSQLTSQRIGLSSEPISAGARLAPPRSARRKTPAAKKVHSGPPARSTNTSTQVTTNAPPTTQPPPAPVVPQASERETQPPEHATNRGQTRDDGHTQPSGAEHHAQDD